MKNLKKDILKKITVGNITPIPRGIFLLRNIAFWGLYAASIVVGALALSLVFFAIFSLERELFLLPGFPPVGMLLTTAFFSWSTLFLLLFLAAIFGIRHTKSGYRVSTALLLLGNFIASLVLAAGLLFFGGAEKIEDFFAERAPLFSR